MSLLSRRRALLSQTGEKYVFVEYIESTGQEWIDTGVIANGDTKVDLNFQIVTITASFMFGSRVSGTNRAYTFNIGNMANGGEFVTAYGNVTSSQIAVADTKKHTVMKNHRTTYFDGSLKYQASKQSFTTPGSLELFACYNNGIKGYLPTQMRLYSCAIYDGVVEGERTLLRDFKPCYRKADKVAGLYDTVSGTFFENGGTGEFLIGGEV